MSRKLLVLLALCAIVAIVAYRASGFDFDWQLFRKSLAGLNGWWLTACVVLTFATYWVRALRWQVLLEPLRPLRLSPLVAITMVGFAAIYALGRAGELARPVWLARREGVPMSGSIATIVVERALDIIMLTTLLALALVAVDVPAGSEKTLGVLKDGAWFVSAIVVAGIVGLLLIRTNSQRIVKLIPFRRIAAMVENFAQGLSFLQDKKSFFLVILHSAVLWMMITLQFWFLLLGMNLKFPLGAATLVMVCAGIGSIAQVPGLGGGFQAAYFFCMTTLFQIPTEQATATALIAWIVSYAPTVVVAAIYMAAQGISMRELKSSIRKPESEIV
jgi:glycosyltransferase 2 family protein